jgi:hypothetical protein
VHLRAVGQFLTWALDDLFEFLLSLSVFLLMEEGKRFVVRFHLRLDKGINQFYAATLHWGRGG